MDPKLTSRIALGGLAGYEGLAAWNRFEDRKMSFEMARARARATGRPLVVIGDPDSGAHTRLLRAYPCGDITIDLHGAPSCPVSIAADITHPTTVAPDSAVVFVSCVFEYVDDAQAAYNECLRMAGSRENLFVVRVQPWTFTTYFYPGAKWSLLWNTDGSPRFEPVTPVGKMAAAAIVGALGYYSFIASSPKPKK